MTYGVETNPNEKKVGAYPKKSDDKDYFKGYKISPGKYNGSWFTAFINVCAHLQIQIISKNYSIGIQAKIPNYLFTEKN